MIKEEIKKVFFDRKIDSIKNDFGKALILGGSRRYPNSVLISSMFASLSGNGYVALGVPNSIYSIIASRVNPMQIFEPSKEENDSLCFSMEDKERIIKTYSSILFGNGILESEENRDLLCYLLKNYKGNLIIDATGISLLKDMSFSFGGKLLLTPHLGEAKKLFDISISSRNPMDYIPSALEYQRKNLCNILLKSNVSYLIDESKEIKIGASIPSQSLAKAGSGDGLAGFLCGMLSYADKIIGYDETILLCDELIHQAAHLSQKENSIGLANILSAKEKIKEIILSCK